MYQRDNERRSPFLREALEDNGDLEMLVCAKTGRVWIGYKEDSFSNFIPTRVFVDLITKKIKPLPERRFEGEHYEYPKYPPGGHYEYPKYRRKEE